MEELTEKCKPMAQSTEGDDGIVNTPHVPDEEKEEPAFHHHPLKLGEPNLLFSI